MRNYSRHMLLSTLMVLTLPPSAQAFFSQQNPAATAEDIRQQSQIETSYALNRYLRGHPLQVTVEQGHVTVTGRVDEAASKELVSSIAFAIPGVVSVNNQVVIDPTALPTEEPAKFGNTIDDISISTVIRAKLNWCKETDSIDIKVRTLAGHVTMSGEIASEQGKGLASVLALETRGVVSVDNQLQVYSGSITDQERSQMALQQVKRHISDDWISTKVKVLLFHTSTIHGNAIQVSSSNGLVTLTGSFPSNAERNLAMTVAQRVRGVERVQTKQP